MEKCRYRGLRHYFPEYGMYTGKSACSNHKGRSFFIVNMKRAWEYLFENIEYPNNLMLLREINKIAMQNLSYISGELRKLPVSIGGTSWTPDMPQEGAIIRDLERINGMEDKLESALEMFCYVARTQMFLDGNKRVAQLIANKIMMENDIGILSIPYDKINDFKNLLFSFYESNNSSELKQFFREKCLLLNPDYLLETQRTDNDSIDELKI